ACRSPGIGGAVLVHCIKAYGIPAAAISSGCAARVARDRIVQVGIHDAGIRQGMHINCIPDGFGCAEVSKSRDTYDLGSGERPDNTERSAVLSAVRYCASVIIPVEGSNSACCRV